jgi:hypothetical protein
MDNLEDFMRRKFDTDDPAARFPFQEEYWEQAQALLEAEEARRRKRRRWLLWWFFGGLLVLGGGVLWRWSGGPAAASAGTSPRQDLATESPASGQAVRDAARANDDFSHLKIPAGDSVFSSQNIENQNFDSKSLAPTAPASSAPNLSSVASPSTQPLPENLPQNTLRLAEKTASVDKIPLENARSATEVLVQRAPEQAGADPRSDAIQAQGAQPAGGLENGANAVFFPGKNLPSEGGDTAAARSKSGALFLPLELLRLPLRAVASVPPAPTLRAALPPQMPPPGALEGGKTPSKWGFDAWVAGAMQQPAPDGKQVGGALGIRASRRWGQHWSGALGLGLRFLPGDWSVADSLEDLESAQLRYSFGVERTDYQRDSPGLLVAELSPSVRWERGPWAVGAGPTLGFLLAAPQRTTKTTEASLTGVTTSREIGLGARAAYRQGYLGVFGEAEYVLNRRLGLLARGHYRFGDPRKVAANPVVGLWGLDLGLRFVF